MPISPNAITCSKTTPHGTPRFSIGRAPRRARTMFNCALYTALDHSKTKASKAPQIQPAKKESSVQEKTNCCAPTDEKIVEKPTEITHANPKPSTEPKPPDKRARSAPSKTKRARASLRRRPRARTAASSVLRTSARSMMMVSESNTPAAMVKVPNTRNMADKAPEEASACSLASSCTA